MPAINTINNLKRDFLVPTISAAMFLSRLPLNQFLERISTKDERDEASASFERTAKFFGSAAIIVALPAAFTYFLAATFGLTPIISSILVVIAFILTTGALHEDALADIADGFGGGTGREQKLKIMRDSQIGTFGGCALILAIGLQVALYAELATALSTSQFLAVLLAANIASTSIMVWPWAMEPAARNEGGLSTKLGIPTQETAKQTCIIGFLLASLLLWPAIDVLAAIVSLAVCWALMLGFTRISHVQIGGHTGDSLGATKKISELGLLLAIIIAT